MKYVVVVFCIAYVFVKHCSTSLVEEIKNIIIINIIKINKYAKFSEIQSC